MVTMPIERELSNQLELVNQLDPEPVFDYLLLHRALDQSTVDTIKDEEKLADRNIKLLQHLEELGNPAVELFINGLRQSGQMHLASSLDVEHRIKPVYGTGYWEKPRYKGQVTISFQLVAAKVLVRKDSEEDSSPKVDDINAMLTPFKVKHSYENMTLIGENGNGSRARKILEYSYEEDPNEKKCCWFCLPIFCCRSSAKRKKSKVTVREIQNSADINAFKQNGADTDRKHSDSSLSLFDIMVSLPSQPSSPIKSGSTFFKTRKLSPTIDVPEPHSPGSDVPETHSPSQKSESLDRNSNHHISDMLPKDVSNLSEVLKTETEVKFDVKNEEVSVVNKKGEKLDKNKKKNHSKKNLKNVKNPDMVEMNNHKNGQEAVEETSDNKENTDPSIYNVKENGDKQAGKSKSNSKRTPPTSLNTNKSPTSMKRSETYELVERWKSEGRAYQTARQQFFSFFDNTIQSRLVRYFEQERNTLVVNVDLQDYMSLCTICMTTKEVKKLREDYEMGVIHEDLVRCVSPQDLIDKMECCAIHLRTVIDVEDFPLAYQELS